MDNWSDMSFWNSNEHVSLQAKLDDLEKRNVIFNPVRSKLFSALERVPFGSVRVCFMGQDPYPDPRFATGSAFSIPGRYTTVEFPATLRQILGEYSRDLRRSNPLRGDLSRWEDQGVLLWNAIPSCECGRSLSHDWSEYKALTKEIVERLSERGIVFVFVGTVARRYSQYVHQENNVILETGHPSPRANVNSNVPFRGSRIFTRINDALVNHGMTTIDWTLI